MSDPAETVAGAAYVALADWGTSNFRLWLVDRDGQVLGECQSPDGMSACAADNRFAAVLEKNLAALSAPASLPVVIAGMAGARAGWLEAAYVETPAPLANLQNHAVSPAASRPVHILPGLCQKVTGPFDVMRGEETQLAGAAATGHPTGVFCLPGTHSKWVDMRDGIVLRFRTSMTGELYELLSKQSILRLSIAATDRSTPDHPVFAEAIHQALGEGFSLTANLFSIRAAGLLSTPVENEAAARLSGFLIGAEIAAMRDFFQPGETVHLIGSESLNALYTKALALAGAKPETLDGSALVRNGLFAAARALLATN